MCHMIADSTEELLAMADRIGVARKWIQHFGTHREHFDVSLAKRKLAVECGAIEVSQRELVARMWKDKAEWAAQYIDGVVEHIRETP